MTFRSNLKGMLPWLIRPFEPTMIRPFEPTTPLHEHPRIDTTMLLDIKSRKRKAESLKKLALWAVDNEQAFEYCVLKDATLKPHPGASVFTIQCKGCNGERSITLSTLEEIKRKRISGMCRRCAAKWRHGL